MTKETILLDSLTNKTWRPIFERLRLEVDPSPDRFMSYSPNRASSKNDYSLFINSILSNIRSGGSDYCFKVSHIVDLLKYENDYLQVEWLDKHKCFKVWLHRATQ